MLLYAAVVPAFAVGWLAGKSRRRARPQQIANSDSDSDDDNDIAVLDARDECKMVLVVRTDLGMSTGKIAAQCSHASLACYKTLRSKNPTLLKSWATQGYLKSVVRCESEDELLLLQAQAQSLNLCARSIQDAGRTQIAAGSTTVLGIAGPRTLVEEISQGLAEW